MQDEQLLQAAKEGRLDEIRRALAADPSLARARSASGETPVMAALYRGHHDVAGAFVDAGAPLDVFAAAALGLIDVLDAELASNPSAANAYAFDGWTPLHLAAFFGHADAIEHLLAARGDMAAVSRNSLANTPLHAAVAGGHAEAALLLIARGAPVNVADAGRHTPLHIAAEAGAAAIVTALLDRGADPHAVDAEDKTPLSRAAARNHNDVIDIINLR